MKERLLLGLAVGASLLVPGCGGGGAASPSAAPTLLDVRPAAVRHLVVTAGPQRVEFTQTDGRVWRAGRGASDEGAALLLGAEERLFPLRGYRRMRADGRDPAFGLIAPAATLTVDAGGRAWTVVIGGATFNGGGFYARVGDSGDVFLLARSVLADLRSLAEGRPVKLPQVEDARIKQVLDREDRQVAGPAADGPWVRQAVDAGATLAEVGR